MINSLIEILNVVRTNCRSKWLKKVMEKGNVIFRTINHGFSIELLFLVNFIPKYLQGAISCSVDLASREDDIVIASKSNLSLGDVLVTRIYRIE